MTFEIKRDGNWIYLCFDGKPYARMTMHQWSLALTTNKAVKIDQP